MADKERVSKKVIEDKARAYLERSRSLGCAQPQGSYTVKGTAFEAIVQKEVAQTIRQLRGVGKMVVD